VTITFVNDCKFIAREVIFMPFLRDQTSFILQSVNLPINPFTVTEQDRKPMFMPRSVHVGFVVYKVALGQDMWGQNIVWRSKHTPHTTELLLANAQPTDKFSLKLREYKVIL
jgi:hypothetical protein